jgi:hypothetical protein
MLLGKPVVNADQTVIILWDAANQTQHFVRKASFHSESDDFGFIVPSPSRPELDESGDEAFPLLSEVTAPPVKRTLRPLCLGIGCGAHSLQFDRGAAGEELVTVVQEKQVAGFDAVVLEAKSSHALVGWLREHNFVLSPEVEAWAGGSFRALKVSKKSRDGAKSVAAPALRISFKTDRPLFPYREPDPTVHAKALGLKKRLLRIYFIAEARYRGELIKDEPWTGQVAWADKLTPQTRQKVLERLKLPPTTGPDTWWLTEFEDDWPYRAAPADVYFALDPIQERKHREPIYRYYLSSAWPRDASVYALAAVVVLPLVRRRRGGRVRGSSSAVTA